MELRGLIGELHGHTWRLHWVDLKDELLFMAHYISIFWIVATAFHPQSWTTKFLEWRVLRFVGRISYSLYL
jgi:peptidoglycan/LPS O-acetylase OafA/YrhL